MLELPESHSLARQLSIIKDSTITDVVVGHSPHRFAFLSGKPEWYHQQLMGETINSAQAWGGRVELSIGNLALSFNDGANIRYLEPGVPAPKKHQLYLGFANGSSLICTVQMYAGILLYDPKTYDDFYYEVAKEKPSPLTTDFDWGHFASLYRDEKPQLSVKALLATEQRIPGLGNGTLQDIAFNARVNPMSRIGKLTESQLRDIFESATTTLAEMTDEGGRHTEKDLFGIPGGYRTLLCAKTRGFPCPGCGGTITRKAYLGGNIYFCEKCQPVMK